jgi:DNA-binding XRE family transcriptional regulator
MIAARARENCVIGGTEYGIGKGTPNLAHPITPIQTRDELAKMSGLSHGTLAKIEKVDSEAPLPIRAAMGKTMSIDKAAQFNSRLQRMPEDERNGEAERLLTAAYKEKLDRINREEKVFKAIHNIISAATIDYEYLTDECLDVYIKHVPSTVEDTIKAIDYEINLLVMLKNMFQKRIAAQGGKTNDEE